VTFAAQLRWELVKLWRRPRTLLGLAVCLASNTILAGLYQLPSVRERLKEHVFKNPLAVEHLFSGLTSAVHVASDTILLVGTLFLALVAGDIVAKELEDGTLRTVFCRPVSRTAVFAQKLIACASYTVVLTVFVGATALVLGLILEGPGPLAFFVPRESIMGMLAFPLGLERYGLAIALLSVSLLTVTLLAFLFSCLPMKPGAATAVALAVMLADYVIRLQPDFVTISPYLLTTRVQTWRQVFNFDVPWPRIVRNYTVLGEIDVALVVCAWLVFVRRELR
jgi:ABC-2 type transport system permease protein